MAEARASSTDEATRKLRTTWKIGEKFPINFVPSVEGMVATTKWRDGVFSVVFVSPPYERQGGSWAEAALTYRTTTSLIKKSLPSYDYPFPADSRIGQEVIKANGNMDMLQEVINYMNKVCRPKKLQSADSLPLPSIPVWDNEDTIASQPPLPLPTTTDDTQVSISELFSREFMDKFIAAFSSRLSCQQTAPFPHQGLSANEFSQVNKTNPKGFSDLQEAVSSSSSVSTCCKDESPVKHHKSKKKKHHSSSSSASSSSSSRSSSSDSTVGHTRETGGSGWFKYPFSALDTRQVTLPRNAMKGKHEERKMLRHVLHTLYSNFTNLRSFVDTLKVDNTTSQFKPHSNDLLWLGHHATYLDTILLQATDGPWKPWNDLSIDIIARSFLELVVRASPTRKYPDIIDEKVRKWMKRKRIGLSSQYGANPRYLSEAKIIEDGIQPKSGWNLFPKRENKSMPFPAQNFKPKTVAAQGMEKKPSI